MSFCFISTLLWLFDFCFFLESLPPSLIGKKKNCNVSLDFYTSVFIIDRFIVSIMKFIEEAEKENVRHWKKKKKTSLVFCFFQIYDSSLKPNCGWIDRRILSLVTWYNSLFFFMKGMVVIVFPLGRSYHNCLFFCLPISTFHKTRVFSSHSTHNCSKPGSKWFINSKKSKSRKKKFHVNFYPTLKRDLLEKGKNSCIYT